VDAAANRHGSQIDRADMPEHGGIDDHHADRSQLGNQDGKGMGDQAPATASNMTGIVACRRAASRPTSNQCGP
jgi:hypothetical protein